MMQISPVLPSDGAGKSELGPRSSKKANAQKLLRLDSQEKGVPIQWPRLTLIVHLTVGNTWPKIRKNQGT